jgi:hypothetical protein
MNTSEKEKAGNLSSEISGTHSGKYVDSIFWVESTVQSGRSLLTFQSCLLPPPSG